jgi:hypothetical protein
MWRLIQERQRRVSPLIGRLLVHMVLAWAAKSHCNETSGRCDRRITRRARLVHSITNHDGISPEHACVDRECFVDLPKCKM